MNIPRSRPKTTLRGIVVCAALALLAGTADASVHRFTVTLNTGGTTVADVPVALRLSPELVRGFDYTDAGDGTHFEIADEAGAILPYEIDTWNPGGESLLWVKVPLFMNGRRLTVTYGRTNEDMTARAAEVWSNYLGVWHMNAVNGSGKYPNSAGDSRFDGEVSSFSRTGQAGKFGQSVQVFTNASHLATGVEKGGVFIPDGGNLNLTNNFTISGWFYHKTVKATGYDRNAFYFDTLFCKRDVTEKQATADGFGLRVAANSSEAAWQAGVCGYEAGYKLASIPRFENDKWRHFAFSFKLDGSASVWSDGSFRTNMAMTVVDNDDYPLAIGNGGKAYLDNEGHWAWGGYADEVRLSRKAFSDDYVAAEYAAMAGGVVYGSETCSLTIDKNEFFGDSVTLSSDIDPAANGKYYVGTTITLTAVPDGTGTFRKWYGDVPKESCTNTTVSFVIERDAWVYARFVHPWTLSADKTTMTDGNFTVNVSEANDGARTLTIGKIEKDGNGNNVVRPTLVPEGSSGSGVIDLGGPITLAGDSATWTITKFAPYKSTQVVSTNHTGEVRAYLSPGTVTASNSKQIMHRGDSKPYFSIPYKMVVVDEPEITEFFTSYIFANQSELEILILNLPHVTKAIAEMPFNGLSSLGSTRFDWWDISSFSPPIANSFFMASWGGKIELYMRVKCGGTLAMPLVRSADWAFEKGTQFFMMPNAEEISLGGATEGTTVTNLCTYAFAGNSSLRKLTLHASPDIQVGTRIFADHTRNLLKGEEVIDGITYYIGDQTSKGRTPDVIHFTGQAVSETAISNLLADVSVVSSAVKPVTILASRFQNGWKDNRRDWISDPTPAERAAYPGQRLLGVYRAGGEAPFGKAVIVNQENDWDRRTAQTLVLIR